MNTPLVLPFPQPDTPALRTAFLNLYLASAGDEATKRRSATRLTSRGRGIPPAASTRRCAQDSGTGWNRSPPGSTTNTSGTRTPA